MRANFIETLTELAREDERIVLLTGDLGFSVIEAFAETHPDRFFNVGVAEQNMVGVATGLAEAGFLPFVYSIVNFAALRPYEFIRNGPVLQRLPVRIVAAGGGFDYGTAGPTHHGLEDLGAMRMLEGMTVLAPADYQQCVTALRQTYDLAGPVYYRLGKDDRTVVAGLSGRFRLGGIEKLHDGADLALVVTGAIAAEAVGAAEELARRGVNATVLVVACLSPIPSDELISALSGIPYAVTIEAHSIVGGLGSLVCELVAESGLSTRVKRVGASHAIGRGGSDRFLNGLNGLTRDHLVETALVALGQSTMA